MTKDGHDKQANAAITIGAAIGGTAGGQFGAQIGKMLAKSKMNKNFINKIKYSPKLIGGARRRKALTKKYQAVGYDIGATTGTTAGALGAFAKELRRFNRSYPGGKRPGKDWYKNYPGYKGGPDVDDLLKNFGSKRKSDFNTKRDVKKAYRDAAKKHHPDIGGSEKKMKDINEAYSKVKKTSWFEKLSHLRMIAMRDEMAKIAGYAKTAFATQPISTQPIDVTKKLIPSKPQGTLVGNPGKGNRISSNAGAPKGPQAKRMPLSIKDSLKPVRKA